MNLSDLFSVYNELAPEQPTKKEDKTKAKVDFHTPLKDIDRVRTALKQEEETSEVTEKTPINKFNWQWQIQQPVQEVIQEKKEGIVVPYEGTPPVTTSKLDTYRTGENADNYKKFRKELDTFIENNPQYASIKENLDYLAALESEYKLGVENYQGSGALGWFQFMDDTRKAYNKQSRQEFSNDAQQQLLAAAKHYTNLQNNIRARGGDHKDFVTMYGAWWRPASAYAYLKDNTYDYKTKYNESLSGVRKRAQELLG